MSAATLAPAGAPLISARGLQLAFPGRAPALHGIDLSVEPGEFVLLTGRSGSGKSTLLSALCGLMPHSTGGSLGGELHVGGFDLREAGPGELGTVCGWVGQDPEAQLVLGAPRGEISLGPELRGAAPAEVARAVEEAAQALGVHGLLDRDVRTLSGGEQQRVAIAAALAQHPRLLVLDEPTSQLDPVASDELIDLLRRFHEQWGLTVILAEHRVDRCLRVAQRVISLDRGQLAFDGPADAYAEWSAAARPELSTVAARVLAPHARARDAATPAGARRAVRELTGEPLEPAPEPSPPSPTGRRARCGQGDAAVQLRGAWRELRGGKTLLRAVDLHVAPGEAVAVMGANGAGKSTLLRLLAGLDQPSRGSVARAGRVALLLQRADDHLLHDRVGDELWDGADLQAAGLDEIDGLAERHPTELSGGERQRLAALVVAGAEPPAALCLDEPTRGLDHAAKAQLAAFLGRLREAGAATIVATHDPDFAASVADRIVLIAGGRVIADAPAEQLLRGGWSLATETARLLAGRAVTEQQGARWLAEHRAGGRA